MGRVFRPQAASDSFPAFDRRFAFTQRFQIDIVLVFFVLLAAQRQRFIEFYLLGLRFCRVSAFSCSRFAAADSGHEAWSGAGVKDVTGTVAPLPLPRHPPSASGFPASRRASDVIQQYGLQAWQSDVYRGSTAQNGRASQQSLAPHAVTFMLRQPCCPDRKVTLQLRMGTQRRMTDA